MSGTLNASPLPRYISRAMHAMCIIFTALILTLLQGAEQVLTWFVDYWTRTHPPTA